MKLKGQVLNLISPLCAKAINKVWNYNRALVQNLQTWFSKATYLSSLQTHACVTHDAFYTFTQAQSCMSSLPTKAVLAQHVVAEPLVLVGPTGANGHQICSINCISYMAALVPFPLPLSVKGQAISELWDFYIKLPLAIFEFRDNSAEKVHIWMQCTS